MSMCLGTLVLLLACSSEPPLGVDQIQGPGARPDLQIASSGADCGQITVSISSTNQVTATFASALGCDYGRAVIAGGVPTYTSTGRSLTVPVRVVNRSSSTVVAPVFMVLPKDSGQVTGGGTASPSNGDSTVAKNQPGAGTAVWRVLTAGTLATNDTSPTRSLMFTLPSRTQEVRLALTVEATIPDTARPETPAVTTLPKANPLTVASTLNPSVTYFRNVVGIRFRPTVSGVTVRQVLQEINATIIGGAGRGTELEHYIVQVPDIGPTFADVQAFVQQLEGRPEIEFAREIPATGTTVFHGRYPTDAAMIGVPQPAP